MSSVVVRLIICYTKYKKNSLNEMLNYTFFRSKIIHAFIVLIFIENGEFMNNFDTKLPDMNKML